MKIRVPATSANLGPGFDTLGMALQYYNHFMAAPAEAVSIAVSPATCVDISAMSLAPEENLLAQAYEAYFRFRSEPVIPATLTVEAHIPLSRGMGSSSTAIVAGLYLADLMHPEPLGKEAILPWSVALEGHPDNVVPAMMGGVRCCLSHGESILLEWPEQWGILLVIPPTPLSTHQAREIMPPHYTTADTVETLRGMAAWIHGLSTRDAALFGYALQADRIHQPARGSLIPEFQVLQDLLTPAQAIGCVISGSGSTLAVYTPTLEDCQTLKATLSSPESPLAHCKIITVKPDTAGATIQ